MAGPTDWVSFQDYLGLNEDEMRQAVADSQASVDEWTDDQQQALNRAGNETWVNQYDGENTPFQQTAGYGQFLDMRDKAQSAYAKAQSGIAPTMEERAMMQALGLDIEMYDPAEYANARRNEAKGKVLRGIDGYMASEKRSRDEEMARLERDEAIRIKNGGLSSDDIMRQGAIERGIDSSSASYRVAYPKFGTPGEGVTGFGGEMESGLLRQTEEVAPGGKLWGQPRKKVVKPLYGSGLAEMWDANAPGARDALTARLKYGSRAESLKDPYWEKRRKAAKSQYEKNKEALAAREAAAKEKRTGWESAWAQDDATWEY